MCSIKSQTHSYFIMPDNFFLIMVKITSNSRLLMLNSTDSWVQSFCHSWKGERRVTRFLLCHSGTVSVDPLRTFLLGHFPAWTPPTFSSTNISPGQFPRTSPTSSPAVYRSVFRIVLDDTLEPKNRGYWGQVGRRECRL